MNSAVVNNAVVNSVIAMPGSSASGTATLEADEVTFSVAAAGLWVARREGVPVGVIEERWRDGFIARDAAARKLGHFKTLDDAKACFDAA